MGLKRLLIDTNIFNLAEVMKPVDFICMSRYEENGVIATSPAFTQDTWAILSQPVHNSIIHQSSIPLGIPGCENRFSEIEITNIFPLILIKKFYKGKFLKKS